MSRLSPKKLCLVADRSLAIRNAAASILRDLRFQVAEAENEHEAFLQYREKRPDAVLLDGAIASADSFDLLRSLIDKPGGMRPKVIFCTADRDPSRIARAIEAGAHEYVIKPFDRTILAAKLEKLGLTA
jgi:two-component system chemotaxis response regulator CheY